MYLFYWTRVQLFFFPSQVLWMDLWTQIDIFQHAKHPNVDPYMFVFISLIKTDTPACQVYKVPFPEDEDYIF